MTLYLLFVHTVAAGDSDMKKVGNTFLQVKLVLNKGIGTEEVFMGELCKHNNNMFHVRPHVEDIFVQVYVTK